MRLFKKRPAKATVEEFERLRGDVFAHHAQLVAEVRGSFPDFGQRITTLEKSVIEVQGRIDYLTKDTMARLTPWSTSETQS